jgi:putative heme transporter
VTRRRPVRGAVGVAVTIVVLVVAFVFVLPQIATYAAVWEILQHVGRGWIIGLAAATAANILTFAPPRMMALPGLGFLNALSMTQASTALGCVVPGGAPIGMAASFTMLRSWGFAARPAGLSVTLTGIWNQLSIFMFPLAALVLLAADSTKRSDTLTLLAILGVGCFVTIIVALAAVLARPSLAHLVGQLAAGAISRLNRLRGRPAPSWNGDALVRFRAEGVQLLRRRWALLTVATLATQLTGYLMLDLSLRAVGVSTSEVSMPESFAAWSIGRLLVSLPLTPGGVGIVELGLTGMLIGFGGSNAQVVAAVLTYRALSIVPTLLLGLLAAATWSVQRPASSL